MSNSSFAQRLAIQSALPRFSVGMRKTLTIGFLAPLSGPVESWGLPGLQGCRLWVDWLNRAGGVLMGGRRFPVRLESYDCGYDGADALTGARHLVQEHDAALVMMLGGDSFTEVRDYLMGQKVLTSSLLTSDLSPDTPYLIAPGESLPIYTVTAVEWIAKNRPEIKTVALCAQTDALGLPALAAYRAAFKAVGIEIIEEIRYDPGTASAPAVVAPMLAAAPDMLCWCTSYTPMVHAMTEYAYHQGYAGQILSCTADCYEQLIALTSPEFMEGFLFQFPDFDDPALAEKAFFFNQPQAFYDEYNARFPGSWTAVSWEYAAILDIWQSAVERAGTVNSVSVLAAMRQLGEVNHAFGPAQWWGQDMFGLDHTLIGDWPVVQIQRGKARIVGFGSIPDWLARHEPLLRAEMAALGQLWHQRHGQGAGKACLEARLVVS
ncbi:MULTISPECIES: ABC transporter substrate-binding protein [unclassified Roseovarius]|uniref:ABC transporter substrate-binding protein n=1 Tax=unclassified Roseovarius TaxID=2614913 RepID=UPI00125BCAAC|nr:MULTISPECIES: ABC transporter substrate-binding protein [unclassified Roseovarius]VVT29080.1 putative ABC transporter, periplasmic substrate-binding protein [Roseovarius sp. EC-SD190]